MASSLWGNRDQQVYPEIVAARRRLIRCEICHQPTSDKYSFRLSEYGVSPVSFLCASCGGRPRTPEEERIAKFLDHINKWRVFLPKDCVEEALKSAKINNADTKKWKLKDKFPIPAWCGTRQKNDFRSRCGEHAARLIILAVLGVDLPINRYSGSFKEPDLGGRFQVRTTHFSGTLNVRENDDPDQVFLSVSTHNNEFRLGGWFKGHEAMVSRYFKPAEKAPYWPVPFDDLHPADTIPL